MSEDNDSVLSHLREVCLAFPEASEQGGVGDPTFKVRDKIFAMRHPMHSRPSVWFKARPGVQGALVDRDPLSYFVPPYVGCHGWVGHYLDIEIDWDEINDLVEESYRMTAPKRLIAQLDQG
jgi:predicted DNA-binding protein (MmcQ/YjbR family)